MAIVKPLNPPPVIRTVRSPRFKDKEGAEYFVAKSGPGSTTYYAYRQLPGKSKRKIKGIPSSVVIQKVESALAWYAKYRDCGLEPIEQ